MVDKTQNTDTLKDMDDLLKQEIVKIWSLAIEYHINEEYIKCYRAYRSIFFSIIGYNFKNKDKIKDITEVLEQYSSEITNTNKTSKLSDLIKFQNSEFELRNILYEYMTLIQNSLVDLKLWFRVYSTFEDFDEQISSEIFNTKKSTINSKKNELRKLSTDEIMKYMTKRQIHN